MAKVVVMPKLGLTMTEGTVSKWLKKVGDAVSEGEPLFEVETDKLTNTIEASASGVLRHLFVEEGVTVPVLEKVAVIAAADEDIAPRRRPHPRHPLRKRRPADASSRVQRPRNSRRKRALTSPSSPGPARTGASPRTT